MVAVPTAMAFTSPLVPTSATLLSLLFQTIFLLEALEGNTSAVSNEISPVARESSDTLSLMSVTCTTLFAGLQQTKTTAIAADHNAFFI